MLGDGLAWNEVVPFLTALAIGLMLGFERERSHTRQLPAGSRTFALLALIGALAASQSKALVVAGLITVGALMVLAYRRTSTDDPGTTTEAGAIATYLLGALAWDQPALAVALAVTVAALLASKSWLHRFARDIVTEVEFEDALKFFVVAFVVLPLVPNRDLGPYGALNPAKIWLLVVFLTGIGWIGYIGVRALGPRHGLLVTGLAGGFVSAAATTASMGRLARKTASLRPPLAGALLASTATFAQLLIVIAVVDDEVFRRLVPPAVSGAAVLLGVAYLVYRGTDADPTSDTDPASDAHPTSDEVAHATGDPGEEPAEADGPFDLRPALVLAVVLTLAILVGRWGADVLGPRGAVLASGAAGLADAHAGSLAAASLAAKGSIGVDTALAAIAAALGANLLVKALLAFTAGGRRFGLAFLAAMVPPTAVFGIVVALGIAST